MPPPETAGASIGTDTQYRTNMSECEYLGEFAMQCIFRCSLTMIVVLIDKQIVQRREVVIRRGRQLQNLLRLPQWMRVFTETDPGMLDGDIRMSAEILAMSSLIAGLGATVALAKETPWDPYVLSLGAVVPTCINVILWLSLIQSRRRLSGSRPVHSRSGHGSSEKESRQYDYIVRDWGLEESTHSVWTSM